MLLACGARQVKRKKAYFRKDLTEDGIHHLGGKICHLLALIYLPEFISIKIKHIGDDIHAGTGSINSSCMIYGLDSVALSHANQPIAWSKAARRARRLPIIDTGRVMATAAGIPPRASTRRS